jgi:hypothetical protein
MKKRRAERLVKMRARRPNGSRKNPSNTASAVPPAARGLLAGIVTAREACQSPARRDAPPPREISARGVVNRGLSQRRHRAGHCKAGQEKNSKRQTEAFFVYHVPHFLHEP